MTNGNKIDEAKLEEDGSQLRVLYQELPTEELSGRTQQQILRRARLSNVIQQITSWISLKGVFGQPIATAIMGLTVGWAATFVYFGLQIGDPDLIGQGLQNVSTTSQNIPGQGMDPLTQKHQSSPDPVRVSFEFYTVLPDLEGVVSDQEAVLKSDGYYMLQVGSYSKQSVAEKMKASLAITGFEPTIQTVNIQDQGQFFRVQVGPFKTMEQLEKANRKLEQMGFKTLRLKVSTRP